ncbi:hypothetical protein MMC07_001459 [Pseudocyphellaria aurata]|nr:hypothetical protein [Pseudocyphellaria aurata]
MASPAIKARLDFLASSAHLYSSAAPATSAHLMLECKRVAASNDVEMKETEPKPACRACGTILLSGWTSRTFIAGPRRSKKPRPKLRKGVRIIPGVASKIVISKCLICHRSTKTPVMTTTRSGVSGAKSSGSQSLLSAASAQKEPNLEVKKPIGQETRECPSANLSSKKRAKARKHGGLQAMLEKEKQAQTHSSGFGLDLMDLMKRI